MKTPGSGITYISKSNTYAKIIYMMRNAPMIGSVIGLRIFILTNFSIMNFLIV